MLDVYICVNMPEEKDIITRYVNAAILDHGYNMEIREVTANPQEMINQLKTSKNMGVYFLDLGGSQEGLILAKKIREYDSRGFVIFITSNLEMAGLSFQYKLEALDFINSNEAGQLQGRINACLDNADKKYKHITRGQKKTIAVAMAGGKLILEYDDIMFFRTSVNERRLYVYTENKRVEFWGKLKEIEQEVGGEFIRCHRAYLVNKKNIKEIICADKQIIMKNQERCPISYRMLKQVKNDCSGILMR